MRQGECFGLTVDRIDFLRRAVRIDRRLVSVAGRTSYLAAPKTPASVRSIPLPTVVVDLLAAHLAKYPAAENGLVFAADGGRPMRRTTFGSVWRAAVKAGGAPHGTGSTSCGTTTPAC
jgi:integrase